MAPELIEPEIDSKESPTPEEIARSARNVGYAREDALKAQERAATQDNDKLAEELAELYGTPAGFVELVLGVDVYDWQSDVLSWFENPHVLTKGSLCTPNGAGKSSVIVAGMALWWLCAHPQGKVVITTKDSKQLDHQIWPAIERHKDKFPEWDFIERMVRNGMGGFIIGFTTDEPGRAEGFHKINDTTGPLAIIIDEGKSVADAIDMATDRCTYNSKLVTSSPGLTQGFFWRSHRADQPEPPIGWHHRKVGLADCPHIPKSRIDNILNEYGPDHWFTRSTLYGEFTDVDSDAVIIIPRRIVQSLLDTPPNYVPGGRSAGCDFAAGRNENVFTVIIGNEVKQHAWKDPDPMRAVYQFIKYFVEYNLRPHEIFGDAGGMGLAVLARFAELGWPIIAVNNDAPARDSVRYDNLGVETWNNGAIRLSKHDLIVPNDPIFVEQLCTRRAAPGKRGLIGYESKKDMEKRGVTSPDRADSFLLALAGQSQEIGQTVFDSVGLAKLEAAARTERQPEVYTLAFADSKRISAEKRMDGWLRVYEAPITGRRYILVLNPAKHDEPLKNHVLQVIRAEYMFEGVSVVPRLAARVGLPLFKMDARPLAEMVSKVAAWYGKCLVVPVVNDRGDVIERMVNEGVHLYSREEFEIMGTQRKTRWQYGWESNDYTRSLWIGAIAEAVRESQVKVEDMQVVIDLYQMDAKNPPREAEALGVGLQLIDYATAYSVRSGKTQRDTPRSMYG